MLDLSDIFTNITHNHPQALSAVKMYLSILYDLMIGLKNIDDYDEREKKSREIIRGLIDDTAWSKIEQPRYFKILNTKETNLSCEYTLQAVSKPNEVSIISFFTRSAIHPNTPTIRCFRFLRKEWKNSSRFRIFCSALSRMEQVFMNTASASSKVSQGEYPAICMIDAITSLSATFIWHP